MKTAILSTNAPKVNRSLEMEFSYPESVEEAVEMFTAESVLDLAVGALDVARQGRIRSMLEKGRSEEEIKSTMSVWKPGVSVRTTAANPLDAAANLFATMDDDQKAEYLEKLKGLLGG